MDIAAHLAQQLNIPLKQVQATLALLQEGNTLPFIARYRKEVTGDLDEEQIRQIQDLSKTLTALEDRRQAVLASLEENGHLTPELQGKVMQASSLTLLEDLYLPFRPKRKTRASMARDKGLQGLATLILRQPESQDLASLVKPFVKNGLTQDEALAGARDIVAETFAETASVRGSLRDKAWRFGRLTCQRAKGEDPTGVYTTYYTFSSSLVQLRPHQVLAIDRGEQEKVLSVHIELEEREWKSSLPRSRAQSALAQSLQLALEDGMRRLLLPAIERDLRRHLSEKAHEHAIANFATNLRGLLGIPPLAGHVVLGLDPGFRTGCKLAVVDATGKVLATDVLYLHQNSLARDKICHLIRQYGVTLVAIGNGTASGESEQLVAQCIQTMTGVAYLVVNEAGASVYSASPLARAELPELDVTLRGAVSIARRVLDPLAELVKIDPRSIGVGMYQHDLDQKRLDEALAGVVESVVNRVGVDLNTASPALLSHVAGIGPKVAQKIVEHRDKVGVFGERRALLKVPGLGPKAYEQCAGFLRVRDGKNPLDASAIHPESYAVAQKVLQLAQVSMAHPLSEREKAIDQLRSRSGLAQEVGVGQLTLEDILEQIVRPGRDPRQDLPLPLLRKDVLGVDDLQVGQVLSGTVRNVVDFGAFVDIGVKQDGLLHRRQQPRGSVLQVGQVLEVQILEVDLPRKRISLGLG